MILIILII